MVLVDSDTLQLAVKRDINLKYGNYNHICHHALEIYLSEPGSVVQATQATQAIWKIEN